MVLAAHNSTVDGLHAFFGRHMPIWEGHVRNSLDELVRALHGADGQATAVADATMAFVTAVTTGFTPSALAAPIIAEVKDKCTTSRRGKPATFQSLAKILVERPDHKGQRSAIARAKR